MAEAAQARLLTAAKEPHIFMESFSKLKTIAESEWVFVNGEGKPFKSIRTAFETAGRNAKLCDVSPHTLRHAFASRLGMSGTRGSGASGFGALKET